MFEQNPPLIKVLLGEFKDRLSRIISPHQFTIGKGMVAIFDISRLRIDIIIDELEVLLSQQPLTIFHNLKNFVHYLYWGMVIFQYHMYVENSNVLKVVTSTLAS